VRQADSRADGRQVRRRPTGAGMAYQLRARPAGVGGPNGGPVGPPWPSGPAGRRTPQHSGPAGPPAKGGLPALPPVRRPMLPLLSRPPADGPNRSAGQPVDRRSRRSTRTLHPDPNLPDGPPPPPCLPAEASVRSTHRRRPPVQTPDPSGLAVPNTRPPGSLCIAGTGHRPVPAIRGDAHISLAVPSFFNTGNGK
jgi:hypothetical protein